MQRRQHSCPNYAATQTEGLLIRGRTSLSDPPPPTHKDQGRGVHTPRAHSPPALGEARLDVHRQYDLKRKKYMKHRNKRKKGDGGRHTGTEELRPWGVGGRVLPVHIMRVSSSCASRREASQRRQNGMGGRIG